MYILGISAYYHDAAAALIQDGNMVFAAQEERFSRIKNDASFPEKAILFCLDEAGLDIADIDVVAFYDKPFLKFERLLETYYAFSPKGFPSFAKAMPVWLKEKLFTKQLILKKLKALSACKIQQIKMVFPEHHLSHAASAFYTSPFSRCAYLTVDGVGEWTTTSFGVANGTEGIRVLGELHFPNSLGLLYSSFTYFLGFEVNSGEYKMMGLAPYGNKSSETVQHYINLIEKQLLTIKDDGSIQLNLEFFNFPVGLRMVDSKKWEQLFGFKRRLPSESLEQVHADFAYAAQKVTEAILLKLLRFIKNETNETNLCFSGGVALNCVANAVLYKEKLFDDIYIQPAAGDAGGAVGAALSATYIGTSKIFNGLSKPFSAYLGPQFGNLDIKKVFNKYKCHFAYYENNETMANMVANLLAQKKVVGWFQGRSEFGPRALGNRSILADATDTSMQYTLNMKIKFREGFRPFAPVVCEEDYDAYFEPGKKSYYMLFTSQVKASLQHKKPENFEAFSLDDKRNFVKSQLPAVTHIDYSARVQVVNKSINPKLWHLIQAYKKLTGVGVLINTSFNVKDEPIVNTPTDAYLCFMKSGMDVLVIENYLIEK